MAARKQHSKAPARALRRAETPPAFPYSTRPGALRKFLAARVNRELIASWGISNSEAASGIQRVLKALDLIGSSNEPTESYIGFMHAMTGPAVLGRKIREVYAPLFGAALEPQKESADALRNLFNIHSGGAPATIELQIQTFKALCDHADLSAGANVGAAGSPGMSPPGEGSGGTGAGAGGGNGVPIHIDLHIHLPENKTSRDYQYIIQDIARFIYRHADADGGSDRE
jgi:hypothetical protein